MRVTLSLAKVTVPAMALPPCGVTVIELLLTVVGSIVSLMSATIRAFKGTAVCEFVGLIWLTVAAEVSGPEPVVNVAVAELPVLPATS